MEYLDIFDVNMDPLSPFRMEKGEVHEKGHWHQVFHCWVIRKDTSGGKMLLQLRGKDKVDNPDTLDISAAGHLMSGETPAEGIRELEEELGLPADPARLFPLGIIKQATDRPGYYNREFCHTYFYETDQKLTDYRPQLSEVDGLFEISIEDGLALFGGKTGKIEAPGIIRNGYDYKPTSRVIKPSDMCGYKDRCLVTKYYLKIFVLADLYLKGHRPLAI